MSDSTVFSLTKAEFAELGVGAEANGFVYPRYDGHCISNIPGSVAKILGTSLGLTLEDQRLYEISEGCSNVVFLLLDGFGYYLASEALSNFSVPSLQKFVEHRLVFPITSVFPSTTSTATTTIHTGLTPQEHGLVGYSMYFADLGTIADTLRFVPTGGKRSLFDLGFDLQERLKLPTIHETLSSRGIRVNLYVNKWIVNSGLSAITSRGAEIIPHLTAPDMFIQLRNKLSSARAQSLHLAYFASPDTLAHARGPFSETYAAELEALFSSLISNLLSKVDERIGRETVLIISADHGLAHVQWTDLVDVQDHPKLLDLLLIPPTGDSRCLFLHARPRKADEVLDYFASRFAGQFEVMRSEQVLKSGLLGRGAVKKGLDKVIGDLVVVPMGNLAVDNSLLFTRSEEMPGRHGGLSRHEMVVPLIATKLSPARPRL